MPGARPEIDSAHTELGLETCACRQPHPHKDKGEWVGLTTPALQMIYSLLTRIRTSHSTAVGVRRQVDGKVRLVHYPECQ